MIAKKKQQTFWAIFNINACPRLYKTHEMAKLNSIYAEDKIRRVRIVEVKKK